MRATTGLLLACFVYYQAQATSFDCRKAATTIEKLICADKELSRLDELLAKYYKAALVRGECTPDTATAMRITPTSHSCLDNPSWWTDLSVRDEQMRWLRERDVCGRDIACLKTSYRTRIAEVTRDEVDNPTGWWLRDGIGDELCDAMHRLLVPYRSEDISACPANIALTLPGLKEAEGWQELNPLDHVELINKLRVYDQLGADAYFDRFENSERGEQLRKKADIVRKKLLAQALSCEEVERRVRELGLYIGVMRIKPLRYGVASFSSPPPEYLTLLHLRVDKSKSTEYWPDSGGCPLTKRDAAVRHYFVTTDLSGPDPEPALPVQTIKNAWSVTYKGDIYFMNVYGSSDFTFDRRDRDYDQVLQTTCGIQWHPRNLWPELKRNKAKSHQ